MGFADLSMDVKSDSLNTRISGRSSSQAHERTANQEVKVEQARRLQQHVLNYSVMMTRASLKPRRERVLYRPKDLLRCLSRVTRRLRYHQQMD